MFDVLKRACRHPVDYSGIGRVTDLEFREKRPETENACSFIFTASALPSWHAGQHAIFTLPNKKVAGKTWRPFSVASAPHEGVIQIGTVIPPEPSSFKRHLLALRPGERVRMYGPFGELYVRPEMKNIVAVAGGIGITPFRSIVADLAQKRSTLPVRLIYSAAGDHAYRDELELWSGTLPNLEIIFTATAEEVNAALEKQTALHGNTAHYLLSGAPKMIEALRRELSSRRISGSRIFNDPFKGY